jgi:malate dehydrogenase
MTRRAKITIVGAGNVGASVAQWAAAKEFGDIVLLDIIEGLSEGKALDLWEAGPIGGFDLKITGSQDYEQTAESDVVVITSGVARKPGMTREDLIDVNRKIIESVVQEVVRSSPECTLLVVTNPLDTMAYLALRVSGFPKNRVLGGHGDEMVPLPRYCTVSGIPITQLIGCEKIQKIIDRTVNAGGEIVKLFKTGSAFTSPGAAVAEMIEAILRDKKRVMPCSAYLDGEYGLKDIYFGVPVKLGAGGVEKILEVELTEEERQFMERSAAKVRKSISSLGL